MPWPRPIAERLLAVAIAGWLVCAGAAAAEPETADSFAQSARVRQDRIAEAAFHRARQQVEKGEFAEAIAALQAILDSHRNLLVDVDGVFRNIRDEANRLLAALPADQLRLYELQFGKAAEQSLAAALAGDDFDQIAEVAVRFRQTQAGLRAMQELAAVEFDRGRMSRALPLYRELLDHPLADARTRHSAVVRLTSGMLLTGETNAAAELLANHRELADTQTVTIAGRAITLTDWLAQKSPESRVQSPGPKVDPPNPLLLSTLAPGPSTFLPSMRAAWRHDTRPSEEVAAVIDDSLSELREQGIVRLSSLSPIVADGLVIARTVDEFVALDAETGELVWHHAPGLRSSGPRDHSQMLDNAGFRALFAETVVRQLQADTIFGTLSSDGRLVYCVESELISAAAMQPPGGNNAAPEPKTTSSTENQLAAYKVRTGETTWRIGGPERGETDPYARVSFLGPPLSLEGVLYVLGQRDTEIVLLAVRPDDGALLWSLPLADAAMPLAEDLHRRGRACPIAAADGLLVCPTSAGIVVAVELLRRIPVWAFRYSRDDIESAGSRQPARLNRHVRDRWWEGWRDTAAIVDGNRVLAVSPESNLLYALDLHSGTVLWKQPREGGLYLAGVIGQTAVVVEQFRVRGFEAATGELRWSSDIEPVGGRGFASATHYYVPLGRGGVAAVDVHSGDVLRTFPPSRSEAGVWERDAGNLLPLPAGVVSQTHARLVLLPSLDASRQALRQRLAVEAVRPELLREQALLDLEAGDFATAAKTLQRLLLLHQQQGGGTGQNQPADAPGSPSTLNAQLSTLRSLLREVRLIELREHPERWRELSAAVKPLAESTIEKIDVLHAVALAAQRHGDPLDALEAWFELLELNPSGELTGVEQAWRSVRFDRQIQGEIADLLASADEQQLLPLETMFDERFRHSRDSQDPFALKRFADRFSQLRWGQWADTGLAGKSGIGVGLLKSQLRLLEIAGSGDRTLAASAIQRLAELMDARSFRQESAAAYRRLRDEFGDVEVGDQRIEIGGQKGVKTDRQSNPQFAIPNPQSSIVPKQELGNEELTAARIVEQLPADSLLAAAIRNGPEERWTASSNPIVTATKRRAGWSEFYRVPIDARCDGLLNRVSVYVDRQGRSVRFQGDGHRGPWDLPLPASKSPFRYMYPLHQGWGLGQFLVLRVGSDLYGISPLDDNGEPNPRLVWALDTMGGQLPKLNQLGVKTVDPPLGFGSQGITLLDEYDRPLAEIGPVRPGYLCYRQKGKLIAVETATGSRLWQRFDVPTNVSIAGDDEAVLLIDAASSRIETLRAIDGKTLDVRRSTELHANELLTMQGRHALVLVSAQPPAASSQRSNPQSDPANPQSAIPNPQSEIPQPSTLNSLQLVDLVDGRVVWERALPDAAVPFRIDSETLGIVERDGTLHVIAARTGSAEVGTRNAEPENPRSALRAPRTTDQGADAPRSPSESSPAAASSRAAGGTLHKLRRPEQIESLYAVGDQHRLYVICSGPLGRQAHQRVNRIRGGYRNPIVNGTLHVFDRKSGRQLWEQELIDAAFPLDQPHEAPLLIVYTGVEQEGKTGDDAFAGFAEFYDQRSGQKLFTAGQLRAGQTVDLRSHSEQAVVELQTTEEHVRIEWRK